MNDVKLNSKHNSDRMSPTRRQLRPLRRNERIFLADQAADAKAAMARTLQDMKDTLQSVADVRLCANQHPWLVVGSAVAAGFVVGVVLTPVPRQSIEITGSSTEAQSQPGPGREAPQNTKSLLFSTALTVLADILQTFVKSLIAAAVVTQDQPQVETVSPRHAAGVVEPNG